MGPSAVKNDFPHDSKRLSSLDGSSFRKGFPKPEDEITVVVIPAVRIITAFLQGLPLTCIL